MQRSLKRNLTAVCLLWPLVGVHAQALSTARPETQSGIRDTAALLSSPEFKALRASSQRQSAAVAAAAGASAGGASYGAGMLSSGVVEHIAQGTGEANRAVERSVGAEQIRSAQLGLPGLDQIAGDIKYGKYVTVSQRGNEIIMLIRSLTMRSEKERAAILSKLQTFSTQGFPEATNFMGLVFEYGLFGATRSVQRAATFYQSAARSRYQPAIFNLAGIAYFGKAGHRDPAEASRLANEAFVVGPESSHRVCGLASFMSYRDGQRPQALAYGAHCDSALANIPNALYQPSLPLPARIKMLRDSIAAGADDGYQILEQITKDGRTGAGDLYCKYRVVNLLRAPDQRTPTRELARECLVRAAGGVKVSEMTVVGVAGFASMESGTLKQLRKTDRSHYSWSVPYLPFNQAEVDLFEPVMRKGTL